LRITGTTNPNATLPASFPAIPISETFPSEGDAVLVAAYPAGFLGGITIAKDLYQLSANATVGDLYTFETSTVDLFSVGGTVVAQQGSSGGAVTDANGSLIGLIVTTTDAPETGARDLRAIAMPYLFRDFKKETGIELQTYVAGDLAVRAQQFNLGTAPTLTQTLIHAIGGF
jgi:S1-C subfamily serine protease